ncbi:MAG: plasmid maintenance system antidote protein [Bacteroidetes bacterium]|nr:plasmid maintenance system antidote protein [Bacteroidota bacterium]
MQITLAKAKGIHPGLILERELRKRRLSNGRFALSIKEYPQTLSAIISGKRSMNTSLAIRIEEALGIEEGFFMTLQVFYDIKEEKKKQSKKNRPTLSRFRPALFWDTSLEQIDWNRQKRSIIKRVFERGNFTEKKEILNYYGHDTIRKALTTGHIK